MFPGQFQRLCDNYVQCTVNGCSWTIQVTPLAYLYFINLQNWMRFSLILLVFQGIMEAGNLQAQAKVDQASKMIFICLMLVCDRSRTMPVQYHERQLNSNSSFSGSQCSTVYSSLTGGRFRLTGTCCPLVISDTGTHCPESHD